MGKLGFFHLNKLNFRKRRQIFKCVAQSILYPLWNCFFIMFHCYLIPLLGRSTQLEQQERSTSHYVIFIIQRECIRQFASCLAGNSLLNLSLLGVILLSSDILIGLSTSSLIMNDKNNYNCNIEVYSHHQSQIQPRIKEVVTQSFQSRVESHLYGQ